MKNKSARHKELNTFKFLPFAERIANIDVDVFHKFGHENEYQEEAVSYFYQAVEKWNVLNLTEGYGLFQKDIKAQNYITLPQVLLSKDHIIEVLHQHLKKKNSLSLQALLEIVVAVAKDLQKEFYPYYSDFLKILIELLNTKDAEQLEWTFTCLAYLFKCLWRHLVKDINVVFTALLPLLSDAKPHYINSFAAESFAFVARKVKDKRGFLNLLLKAVKTRQDGVTGCGKLLFQVIKGIEGQFHSYAETFLPFLLESLSDENLCQDTLFEILEQVVQNIVLNIHPQKSDLYWKAILTVLKGLTEKVDSNQNTKVVNEIELVLKLVGQSLEYKVGKFIQNPAALIEIIHKLLSEKSIPESLMLILTQIGILLLVSKNVKLSQEQASQLTRKLLNIPYKTVLLYFVENSCDYSSFEALILPNFLQYCVLNNFDTECFHILVKVILKKAPVCLSGIKLPEWVRYPVDFKEQTSVVVAALSKHIQIDSDVDDFDNYFCTLVCLPHIIKTDSELSSILETNVANFIRKIKDISNNKENSSLIKKTLFLLNVTLQCLIHFSGIEKLSDIFVNDILNVVLPLAKDWHYLTTLNILSLCVSKLKDSDEVIRMDYLLKINDVLEQNFSSPFHEIRLLTAHIYAAFDKLEEFKLNYSTDPEDKPIDWEVFQICYNIESIDPQIDTYRTQLQNLEKFNFDKPQIKMCNQTAFKLIPLRYLCCCLCINFRLLWEPITKIIASHANGLEISAFWTIFGQELKNVCLNIQSPEEVEIDVISTSCSFIGDLYQNCQKLGSKPDFVNYRMLLWQSMGMFTHIAEIKTRDVSELVLNFIEKEYVQTNSEVAPAFNIKEYSSNVDIENDEEDTGENQIKTHSKGKMSNKKLCAKTLLHKLNVLSKIRSPMSMYREPELYKLYFDLLQHRDSNIQKVALDCIMSYKHKSLTPYKEQLYGLADDRNFKNILTTFRVNHDTDSVRPEHRENLIPIMMQIAFSKMNARTGLRTGGKSSGQMRRNLVFRFLAGCQESEMIIFLHKVLKLYDRYILDDPVTMVDTISQNTILDKYLPPKKLQSTINLLTVIFNQFGGLMGNEVLTYLLQVLFAIGALLKVAFNNINDVHSGYHNILKNLRTSCVNLVANFFKVFDKYLWTSQQIQTVFELFVWPSLEKLNVESIHSPTALLKLIMEWGSNPRYFPLLVKHKEGDESQYILVHLLKLLINEKCHITIVNAVEDTLEKLITLVPDEEDLKMVIPVDNLLPIQEYILQKVGLIDKLNYGSCILLPHVAIILDKIKKKLKSKSKNLSQRELFILSRISELVWEADISDTVLDLLLPVISKKCSFSTPEDIVLRYTTTVYNLIKNVEKPVIHLKYISPLFGELSYPSCRKKLCEILEVIATKSQAGGLDKTKDIIINLNAFDAKWIDQPDFERRHDAFKAIQAKIDAEDIELSLGILMIYCCSFFIRSEKDLSLRENASHILKQLSIFLLKKNPKNVDYILNETLFTLIRSLIKSSTKDHIRNEAISLLGHLARECPESHFILRDLHIFTNKTDLEVDFFENLVHLQLHRHGRALLKLSQILKEQTQALNPRTLTQFILPLASHYLCREQFVSKNSIIDAAIESVGTICRILPWHQYEIILTYYLNKLRFKVDYQKQLVKLTVAILDAFHFDLNKGIETNIINDSVIVNDENMGTGKVTVSEDVTQTESNEEGTTGDQNDAEVDEYIDMKTSENDHNDDANDDDEATDENKTSDDRIKICDKITVLCKSTSTRVIKTIEIVLLPKLNKSLAQMTQHDSSHKINRKRTGAEREEEDLLRVPISLAVVKLLQRLPEYILDANITGVFMKICTFLKSHLESVRRVTREVLQSIMLTLGPKYLGKLIDEMTSLLNRGFQVHVLVFTIHGILSCLKDMYRPKDIDSVLAKVQKLCTADLFGILSEEKEVVKIAVKVSEARHTKTYDTLQVLARYVTESCLLDLILPLKQVLETSHSYKSIHKAEEALRYIALGLVDNTFISIESLLKFAYGIASESIPQLLPKKKTSLTEKESEKLHREKEDCFIIPKIPGNRTAYRQQNVKTSAQTNAYLLVEFGLRLCHVMLKREKLKDDSFKVYIDPFVTVFKKCLKSRHVKLCTLTLQCLIWVFKYELPSLKQSINSVTRDIFDILHKYASAGLSKGDNFDLVVSAFKASSVLVRDIKYYTVNQNQMKILLLYVEQDMHDHDRQATAFSLLKAIIARKINVPELHEIIKKVAELSITSELSHVRDQARAIFHQFIMEYPLGNTLESHIAFYLAQMSFELRHGRESAIEMIQTLINSFPLKTLQAQSGTLLISLGARLINEEEPAIRKMVAQCVSSMLNKLSKEDIDPLFDIVLLWLKDRNMTHRQLAAQLCGFFIVTEKSTFEDRLPKLLPLILKQFGLNHRPGKFVKLKKEDKTSEEDQKVKDHHLFQVLQLVLKLCAQCPSFLKQKEVVENLAVHVQTLLSYPHDWVRLAAAQFLGYVLSIIDIDHLSELILSGGSEEKGFLVSDPMNSVKSLILDLCDQLQPEIKSDLAEQVVKNLVFAAKVLQNIPIVADENTGKINLLWLTKRMRKVVNAEVVKNPSNIVLRTEVFKWIAGVVTVLETEKFTSVLHHLMGPLVREMITEDEKNAPLRQLAKEVSNLIKKKIGMEEYTNILMKLQQNLTVKRSERKRARTQLAVTDPERFAKKKIKRHEKKRELRKRKIDERKGTKRNFKRRKTADLEISSEVM